MTWKTKGLWLFLAVALCAGVAIGATGHSHSGPAARVTRAARPGPAPNVVFVLTDDLAWNLVRFMPHVRAMERDGVTFRRYFVTDSLCCPSRASIFTGRLPHDTGVFSNSEPDGGFRKFNAKGEEQDTFATALQSAGYHTAMMGKYLNGYVPTRRIDPTGVPYEAPGWSEWDVAGHGYPEFGYKLATDGRVQFFGHRRRDYLTNVLARRGVRFIRRSARAGQPFMLELATFAPHRPYTPAPQDRHKFHGLRAPRDPSFDRPNTAAPSWLALHPPLTGRQIAKLDRGFRKRAQSVQAVDRMIGRVENALKAAGVAGNTYVVFSSDNGLHMGQHRLTAGKLTAFDSDIHVPLVVMGPGVPASRSVDQVAENVDLAPTFAELARTRMQVAPDGRSLVPLLQGRPVRHWRDAVLVEHRGPVNGPGDPDRPEGGSGNPTSYEALRLPDALYVEYMDGEREYYDLRHDPYERHNVFASLPLGRAVELHARLARLAGCHRRSCTASG